ncbi:MAG: D-alanine--D-alanine ligase [Desulfuromonas sp.]|nr:MAG: D-alanine--D-alanine ligase [Desulfuromonas sp.]
MTREELKKKQVAVLMGGMSGEREVSLRTGKAILGALQQEGYRAVGIDVGRDLPVRLAEAKADCAFVALHGRYGEDGSVQGMLELLGIPYTGSGVLASALAMDKALTKQLLLHHELPTPGYHLLTSGGDPGELIEKCRHFPVVVKPVREGSTIGITIARDRKELESGLIEALRYDDTVMVEDFIDGLEVTVGVLGGEALPIIQIVPEQGFYDYTAKYTPGKTEFILPAPLEPRLYNRVQEVAERACRILGCRGAARVDFMVRQRECFCLEVNTVPGMTATSLLPKAATEAGIPFPELVQRILEQVSLDYPGAPAATTEKK